MAQMLKRQRPPRNGAPAHKMRIPTTIDNRARLSATEGGFGDGFSCRIFPSEGVLGDGPIAPDHKTVGLLFDGAGFCRLAAPNVYHFGRNLNFNTERGLKMLMPILDMLWNDEGQDIAEYAVMLAVILVIVVGTIRLIGSNANSVFSQAASSIQ